MTHLLRWRPWPRAHRTESTPRGRPSAALLRHPPFAFLWSSRLLANVGFHVLGVAVGWQLYALTGRALDLGLVGLVQFVPMVLLTLIVGQVADRYDRRLIAAVCQFTEAAAAGTLVVGTLAGWQSNTSILGIVSLVGAAGLFVLASVCAAVIRSRRAARATEPLNLENVFSGIAFIRSRRVLLGTMSLDLFAVLLGGATALLPIYARDILGTGPRGLGVLRSAPAVGALATSMFLAYQPLRRRIGPTLFRAVMVFGAATVVFGVSTNFALSLAALCVLGASDVVSVVIRASLVQIRTPDTMRGRVSAVHSLFTGTSNQLGAFESGLAAALFGTVPAVLLGGLGTIAVAGLWMILFPELRRLGRFEE